MSTRLKASSYGIGFLVVACSHSAPPATDDASRAQPVETQREPESVESPQPTEASARTPPTIASPGASVDTTPVEMSMEGFPHPVDRHTAVWTGKRVIFWGGNEAFPLESNGYAPAPNVPRDDGGIYDPANDTWSPVPKAPIAPRLDHIAVWSGKEMIVFGGEGPKGRIVGDGAAFDPTTNRWRKISRSGAPQARTRAAGVWTGTHLVIAGGVNAKGDAVEGAFTYDPKGDRWQTAASPSARSDATLVWTGEELVLWGATEAGLGAERSGSDTTWTPLPTEGAPQRPEASVVWAGEHLIVWGGVDEQQRPVAAGARWSLGENRWMPVATSGAYARSSPVALSTTDLMLVLGEPGGDDMDAPSLGVYSVQHDRWWSMPGPYPSSDIAAVWTGSELIAWGGFDGTNMSPTGERVRLR